MKHNKKFSVLTLAGAIVISLVFIVLMVVETMSCRQRNLCVYASYDEQLATGMLSMAAKNDKPAEYLVQSIKDSFDTSASKYCVVALNEDIIFQKDDTTTKRLEDTGLAQFLNGRGDAKVLDNPAQSTSEVTLADGKKYLVASASHNTDDGRITLVICSRKDYVVKKGEFDLLSLHVVLNIVLMSIAFVAIVFFMNVMNKKLSRKIEQMSVVAISDRKQIENLEEEKTLLQQSDINDKSSGFLARKTVETILQTLTYEQKAASSKLKIKTYSESDRINMAIILDRINIKGYISCLWSEDTIFIVCLNQTEDNARRFFDTLVERYEREFQTSMPQVDVVIDNFQA